MAAENSAAVCTVKYCTAQYSTDRRICGLRSEVGGQPAAAVPCRNPAHWTWTMQCSTVSWYITPPGDVHLHDCGQPGPEDGVEILPVPAQPRQYTVRLSSQDNTTMKVLLPVQSGDAAFVAEELVALN